MPETSAAKPVARSRILRKVLLFGLKVAIAAGLIYGLVQQNRLNFKDLQNIPLSGRTGFLALATALCVAAGLPLLAWRFRLLLAHQSIAVSYRRALGLTLIGSFFGAVLPGLVGGDVIKAVYVCADAPGRRADAVAAVVIDRAIGLYALMLLGSAALLAALAAGTLPFENPVLLAAPIAVGLGTAGMALLAWARLRQSGPVQKLFDRLPRRVQNVLRALTSYVKSPRVMAVAIGLSLVNHALVVISFFLVARLLDNEIAAFTHFVLNPLAMTMNAVALTPGGVGFAEGAFSYLFELAGAARDTGAMVGLVGRLIQYGVFTVTGVAALLALRAGRRLPSTVELESDNP
jgi:glycosyltransferase 2 family protein